MTIEEMRAQHPEVYNQIRDAAVKEGETAGVKMAGVQHEAVMVSFKAESNNKVTVLEADLKSEKDKVITLTVEKKSLTDKLSKVEGEKLVTDIKSIVVTKIAASEHKDFFKEEDVADICKQSATVEDAEKEIISREKLIADVVSRVESKADKTGSIKTDTSEGGSSKSNDDWKKAMRESAGLC